MAVRLRILLIAAAVLAVAAAIAVGCSSTDQPGSLGPQPGSDGSIPLGDPCLDSPTMEGCSCSQTGESAACGKVIQRNGNYVTCSMGHALCDGHAWGQCEGDSVVMKSIPGQVLSGGGLRIESNMVPCTNLCDPNGCASQQGTGSDIDAGGLTITEGGVSILPQLNNNDAGGDGASSCTGLQCNLVYCADGGTTSITGTVYDPAGLNPLYNAYVYIPLNPDAGLPAFTTGPTCDTCAGVNINAIASAQTAADGTFTLTNVPTGANIPLVIQMGKWRRETTLSTVSACANNPVGVANSRLPRNQTDGLGGHADIPKMAFVSGSADPFECFLLKTGLDPNEFGSTTLNSSRRILYFNGTSSAGATIAASYGNSVNADDHTNGVYYTASELNNYDVVLLACEGGEHDKSSTAPNAYTNMVSYANSGGKVFATHYGYVWPLYSAWNVTAPWYAKNHGEIDTQDPMDTTIVTAGFPKGQAFSQWLTNVNAATSPGHLDIHEGREDLDQVKNPPYPNTQPWMTATDTNNGNNVYSPTVSFNTPYPALTDAGGADGGVQACGRVVYTDFHVSSGAVSCQTTCSCGSNNDCGFTATCNGGSIGTCTAQTCTRPSDCETNAACSGFVGTCGPKACTMGNQCSTNTCTAGGQCTCNSTADCRAGESCTGPNGAKICTGAALCSHSAGSCGGSEQCNGRVTGTCSLACATDSDCNGTERCSAGGVCTGCDQNSDCPSGVCAGGAVGSCSAGNGQFPLVCRQGPLSPQEKALEFLFFDLTACVSPDNLPPPPPPPPTTIFPPETFTVDFNSSCPTGTRAQWREFDWQDVIPAFDAATGPNIVFQAETVDPNDAGVADFTSATPVQIAKATVTTPNIATGNYNLAYIDTGPTGDGGFNTAMPQIVSKQYLRMIITLNPSSDEQVPPTLVAWKVQYDCVPAE